MSKDWRVSYYSNPPGDGKEIQMVPIIGKVGGNEYTALVVEEKHAKDIGRRIRGLPPEMESGDVGENTEADKD